MEEKIVKEIIIPKEEYLEFNVETNKPLNVYKQNYKIFANLLNIKRKAHKIRDLRFDATDNSFFIRIDVVDTFDETKFFKTSYIIENIFSGVMTKDEKKPINIKLRARLILEATISDENKIIFLLKKLAFRLYYILFYEKVFEDRRKRLEETLEKLKNEFIRILT